MTIVLLTITVIVIKILRGSIIDIMAMMVKITTMVMITNNNSDRTSFCFDDSRATRSALRARGGGLRSAQRNSLRAGNPTRLVTYF